MSARTSSRVRSCSLPAQLLPPANYPATDEDLIQHGWAEDVWYPPSPTPLPHLITNEQSADTQGTSQPTFSFFLQAFPSAVGELDIISTRRVGLEQSEERTDGSRGN